MRPAVTGSGWQLDEASAGGTVFSRGAGGLSLSGCCSDGTCGGCGADTAPVVGAGRGVVVALKSYHEAIRIVEGEDAVTLSTPSISITTRVVFCGWLRRISRTTSSSNFNVASWSEETGRTAALQIEEHTRGDSRGCSA